MKKGKRISAQAFSRRFTNLVSDHLSSLPPEEQDRRIEEAEREALKHCRDAASTVSSLPRTARTPLAARTRE